MGGRNYVEAFVKYVEISERIQRYRSEIVGMSQAASEDVCGRMFGYSEKDLRDEERKSREQLLEAIKKAFPELRAEHIWADGCLLRGKEFLESNLTTLLSAPSGFTAFRCQSYKRNLRKMGNPMTPRELEDAFHKECLTIATANEKRKEMENTRPMTAMAF
jgi:hypothetical protein